MSLDRYFADDAASKELVATVQSIVCQVENIEHWLGLLPAWDNIRAGEMEALIKNVAKVISLSHHKHIPHSHVSHVVAISVLSDWLKARAKSSV